MVRKYKRKTEVRHNEDNLRRALQAIAMGTAIRAAARDFGVSECTLRRHRRNNGMSVETVDVQEEGETSMEMEFEIDDETAAALLLPNEPIEQEPIASTSTQEPIVSNQPTQTRNSARISTTVTSTETIAATPAPTQPSAQTNQPMVLLPPTTEQFVIRKPGRNTVGVLCLLFCCIFFNDSSSFIWCIFYSVVFR